MNKFDADEESCCSIDYEHHREIFERRRRAFLEHPEKAVTVHQTKSREGRHRKGPGSLAVPGFRSWFLTPEPSDAVCVIPGNQN
jgi:hypothetical protein